MSQSLSAALRSRGSDCGNKIWLKSSSYARKLLVPDGVDPWESAAQYLAMFSQAQGLLRPSVAVLEVGDLFDACVLRRPDARASLSAKRRPTFPLRRLLELEEPRALLAEVITAVSAHLRGESPLVLSLPAPMSWLTSASVLAGLRPEGLEPESAEDAAMYMADLVRSVSELPVSGVLLEERPDSVGSLEYYRPLINVVQHYRWELALRLPEVEMFSEWDTADVDVLISDARRERAHGVSGNDASNRVWGSDSVPELGAADFYFLEVPPDRRPEAVLELLARLRS